MNLKTIDFGVFLGKSPGITLSMIFPKMAEFEQKLAQIRNLKLLGIQPNYMVYIKNYFLYNGSHLKNYALRTPLALELFPFSLCQNKHG